MYDNIYSENSTAHRSVTYGCFYSKRCYVSTIYHGQIMKKHSSSGLDFVKCTCGCLEMVTDVLLSTSNVDAKKVNVQLWVHYLHQEYDFKVRQN